MQTDYFSGPTVVHCHILMHEDQGMMITVNFTGTEGTRYPPAYGYPCATTVVWQSNQPRPMRNGTRVGTCPLAPPPPPPTLAAAEAKAATATAEANTWKVTAIVLGVVLAAVLLLVAAVCAERRTVARRPAARRPAARK